MNLSNKRDLREAIKSTLWFYVEEGSIELEDLKTLLKTVMDNVQIPISASKAKLETLKSLLSYYENNNINDTNNFVSRVTDAIKETQLSLDVEEVARMNETDDHVDSTNDLYSTSTHKPTESKETLFSLSALRARLAERKRQLECENAEKEKENEMTSVDVLPSETIIREEEEEELLLSSSSSLLPSNKEEHHDMPTMMKMEEGSLHVDVNDKIVIGNSVHENKVKVTCKTDVPDELNKVSTQNDNKIESEVVNDADRCNNESVKSNGATSISIGNINNPVKSSVVNATSSVITDNNNMIAKRERNASSEGTSEVAKKARKETPLNKKSLFANDLDSEDVDAALYGDLSSTSSSQTNVQFMHNKQYTTWWEPRNDNYTQEYNYNYHNVYNNNNCNNPVNSSNYNYYPHEKCMKKWSKMYYPESNLYNGESWQDVSRTSRPQSTFIEQEQQQQLQQQPPYYSHTQTMAELSLTNITHTSAHPNNNNNNNNNNGTALISSEQVMHNECSDERMPYSYPQPLHLQETANYDLVANKSKPYLQHFHEARANELLSQSSQLQQQS